MKISYQIKHKSLADIEESLDDLQHTINELHLLQDETTELAEEEVPDIISKSILLINMLNNFIEAEIISQAPNNGVAFGIAFDGDARPSHTIVRAPDQEEESKENLLSIIQKAIATAQSIESALQIYQENPNQEAFFYLNDNINYIEEETLNINNHAIPSATTAPINFEVPNIAPPSIMLPSHTSSILPGYISLSPYEPMFDHHPLYRENSQGSDSLAYSVVTNHRVTSFMSDLSLGVSTPGMEEGFESPIHYTNNL